MEVKKGQVLTLKPEYLGPGEPNPPHIALEDGFAGFVRVEIAGDWPYPLKPITDWRLEWIA